LQALPLATSGSLGTQVKEIALNINDSYKQTVISKID